MERLMVPFDGSENSERALRHAIRMAQAMPGLGIHLVYAHEESLGLGVPPDYLSAERVAELQHAHGHKILEPAEAMLREAAVPHATEILVGHVAEVIAERAARLGCSGIVMGARGLSGVKNLILGSISTKLIHLAAVPVTVVK